MTLELYYTRQGQVVIGDSSEAKALGYSQAKAVPTTTYAGTGGGISSGYTLSPIPQQNQSGGSVLLGTGTITHPLGATPTDVAVTQGIGQTTYGGGSTSNQNYITATVNGKQVVLGISSGVAEKINAGGGLEKIMNNYYFGAGFSSQTPSQQQFTLASQGIQKNPFTNSYFKTETKMVQDNSYDAMLTERATRPEFLAFQTITNPLEQAMKGYAGLWILATGGNIDYARQVELGERKGYIASSLTNPFIPVTDIAMTGVTLFTMTGGNLITGTNFGKLFQVGLGSYGLYRSADLGVQTVTQIAKEGQVTLETGGKLAMSIVGDVVSSTLIYSGWKQPTVWSAISPKQTTVQFEGESKTVTVGSADYEKGIAEGKIVSSFTQKGTQEAFWGIQRRDITAFGRPRGEFTSKLGSMGEGTSETWSPNIVTTRQTTFGRLAQTTVQTPTEYSRTFFWSEPEVFKTVYATDKRGTINFGSASDIQQYKVFATTEASTFEGLNIRQFDITGTISDVSIVKSLSVPYGETKAETVKTVSTEGREGTITYGVPKSSSDYMITKTQTYSTGKVLMFKESKSGVYEFVPVGNYKDVGLSIIKMPLITSSTGGGGQQQLFRPDNTIGGMFGGGTTNVLFQDLSDLFLTGDMAKTTAITTASLWQNFNAPSTKYRTEQTYTTYPQVQNEITQTASTFNVGNVEKSAQGSSFNLQSNFNLGQSLGTITQQQQIQTQTQTQTQLQSQTQLQQQSQLSLQTLVQANAFNFNMNVVTSFKFGVGVGMFAEGRKSRKQGRRKTTMVSAPRISGSPISDLLNITVTEAGLLRKGKMPKATVLTGRRATKYFFKSAGLSIPTVQQVSGKLGKFKFW